MTFEEDVDVVDQNGVRGLVARRDFKRDEGIFRCFNFPREQPLNYVNHSCSPNCALHFSTVYAKFDIHAGTELTLDYRLINFTVAREEFDCRCGAPNCAGHIKVGR
jgi:SET domain-containing protein